MNEQQQSELLLYFFSRVLVKSPVFVSTDQ